MLAACGGSSGKTTSSATASASASATTTTGTSTTGAPEGPGAGRFAALRECLQKNGITLPKRTPGQRPRPGAGGFLGGGAGAATAQGRDARAVRSGAEEVRRRRLPRRPDERFNPAFKQALAKFAACMRENGVNVPAPNTSGNGPIFNTKGLNTDERQFKAAERKCSADLRGAVRRRGRGGGARIGRGTATG